MSSQMVFDFFEQRQSKRCSSCKEAKPLSCFHRCASNPDGLAYRCKDCQALAYRKNAAKYIERSKKWAKLQRQEHPELVREQSKLSYRRNIESIRAYRVKRRIECPERDNAVKARYVANNKDKVMASKRKWINEHRDHFRAIKVANQRLRKSRKDSVPVGNPDDLKAFYKSVKTAEQIECRWCGRLIPKGYRTRYVDHVIPVSRGGHHSVDNLCCSCSYCNSQKHDMMPDEFLAKRLSGELASPSGDISVPERTTRASRDH